MNTPSITSTHRVPTRKNVRPRDRRVSAPKRRLARPLHQKRIPRRPIILRAVEPERIKPSKRRPTLGDPHHDARSSIIRPRVKRPRREPVPRAVVHNLQRFPLQRRSLDALNARQHLSRGHARQPRVVRPLPTARRLRGRDKIEQTPKHARSRRVSRACVATARARHRAHRRRSRSRVHAPRLDAARDRATTRDAETRVLDASKTRIRRAFPRHASTRDRLGALGRAREVAEE